MSFISLHSPEAWRTRFRADGRRATISVGNFDGLHLGHRKILEGVLARARATNTLAAVVTFDPHPLKVLRPDKAPPLVETLDQRLAGFDAAGLDAALILQFDRDFAALSAADFVRTVLTDLLRTETILVGKNFRFGNQQQGDIALLAALRRDFGFAVEIVPPVVVPGPDGTEEIVSSTAVRRAVLEGRVRDATRLLGRPFVLTGAIETGMGRGSTILFPTLNLRAEQELLPKPGVYATEVRVCDDAAPAAADLYGAATNVGFRPTFNGPEGSARLSIESHLFGFSRRLTSGHLEVYFRERLRDEMKFSGPEELRHQIAADLDRAHEILQHLTPDSSSAPSRP